MGKVLVARKATVETVRQISLEYPWVVGEMMFLAIEYNGLDISTQLDPERIQFWTT